MYTDEDLYSAVKEGIFEEVAVNRFRNHVSRVAGTSTVDEENFRLISGFNDIFVSIAAFILLVSAGWIAGLTTPSQGFLAAALISWLLSLFFVKKKKLALPGILFLVAFVGSVTGSLMLYLREFGIEKSTAVFIACGLGALAAWVHWLSFKVPITVAAGVASLTACILTLLAKIDSTKDFINLFVCLSGVATFLLAMIWDSKDTERKTRKSDVAFWLHLLAAPLIVHPIFSGLGILKGESGLYGIGMVVLIYVLLGAISIAVDRRALMVSSLIYVLYAFTALFNSYGMVSISFAVSGAFIGSLLLLLSAYWHKSRSLILHLIPNTYKKYLP